MPSDDAAEIASIKDISRDRHSGLVKSSHWIITVAVFLLLITGFTILRTHPRLYWGEVGNDLTPALFELPISRNYKHGGWTNSAPFFASTTTPITASRTYQIFNQNSWGRSLHFLTAWLLVGTGALYLCVGFLSGHFSRSIIPKRREISARLVWSEAKNHARLKVRAATGGPQYGILQKWSYFTVIFGALPFAGITGLAMSPAVTASYPFLYEVFGGVQSARTIHFFVSMIVALFVIAHLIMIILSGFKRQIRGMTIGEKP